MARSSATAPKKAPPAPEEGKIWVEYCPVRSGEDDSGENEPHHEPVRQHDQDAGLDLVCTRHVQINPDHRALIPHNIRIALPPGHYGQIVPRSSTFHKTGLLVLNGVLDAGYRGEIQTVVFNTGKRMVHLHPGDRVSQLLVQRVIPVHFELVEEDDMIPGDRGEAGFGSTGVVSTR